MTNFSMVPRESFVDWLLLECPLSSSQKTIGKCSLTNVILWDDSLEFRPHEISKFIVSLLPSTYGRAVYLHTNLLTLKMLILKASVFINVCVSEIKCLRGHLAAAAYRLLLLLAAVKHVSQHSNL